MKLVAKTESFEIEDGKRFSVPGTALVGSCPKCKADFKHDFAETYLSYPVANKPFDHTCYCHGCDHEWTLKLQLNVSLIMVP